MVSLGLMFETPHSAASARRQFSSCGSGRIFDL
jgi:hypothetical protein